MQDRTRVPEPSTDQGGNLACISAATEISELEHMLKQKTFTRSEIERLTALLHSRTNESPSDDVDEGDNVLKHLGPSSHLLRLEASTSSPVEKHAGRENFHAAISTPVVNSRVFEEDIASPAELAKAYMGTRPAKVSPLTMRLGGQAPGHDSMLLGNTTIVPKTPITSLAPKDASSFRGLENGFTTPRSRGRSAIYNMARTPYYRGPSTFSQKGNHGVASPSLTLPQPAFEHEGAFGSSSKMDLKRRSSVLDDDIGSGGPLRRIRQKANLHSRVSSLSKHRSESGSSAFQQPNTSTQKLLIRNEPEPKVSKTVEENGETSMRSSGYASVPTKSTQMASKILEQLDRLSPKEKPSRSNLAGTNEKSPNTQKPESQHHAPDARKSASQSKDKEKVEENGPRKFDIPRNVLSSMNGNATVSIRENAVIGTKPDSTMKLPAEPPQKKRAFQMSAHEDSFELDDDNHSNGYVSVTLAGNKKAETPSVVNKAEAPAEIVQTSALPEVPKTSSPEATKITAIPEFKNIGNAHISSPKTDFGPPKEQKIGFNLSTSVNAPSAAVFSQTAPKVDTVAPMEPKAFTTFGTGTKNDEKVPPLLFSANDSSGFKADAKPLSSTSVFNSVTKNDQVQSPAPNKDDIGNGQKSVNTFRKLESLTSNNQSTNSTSGVFAFGGSTKSSSITNGTSASNSSPFPAFGNNTNKLFSTSSPHVTSSAATTAVTFAASSVISTTAPTPVFSFGSATASSTSASETTDTKDKEPKSNVSSSSFASPNTGSSVFGFTSAAATTSTTTNHQSQGSFFNAASGSQANTQAVPFQFGSSSPSFSGTTAISSSTSTPFGTSTPGFGSVPSFGLSTAIASSEAKTGSSASGPTANAFGSAFSATPTFGLGSAVTSSEAKATSSASGPTANPFGSAFSATPTFGLGSAVTSSEAKAGSSASGQTANAFGSAFSATPTFGLGSAVASLETKSTTGVFGSAALQPPKSSAFGSSFGSSPTPFSFGASSTTASSPIVFGSGAATGSSAFSFTAPGATNSSFPHPVFGNSTPNNNNNQMSLEDSMAEDPMQTPSPSVPTFGQATAPTGAAPGFMFGSATPPQTAPFQFGGQASPAPPQNPFQASGSVEFNGGGSFSLGSGGGDKSGRRIFRAAKSKNRRK